MVRFLADHTTVRRRLFSGFPDDQPNPLGAEPHGLTVWPQPGRYSLGHTGNLR